MWSLTTSCLQHCEKDKVSVSEEWISVEPCLCEPQAEGQPFPPRQGSSANKLSGLRGHEVAVEVVFQPERDPDVLPSILESAQLRTWKIFACR